MNLKFLIFFVVVVDASPLDGRLQKQNTKKAALCLNQCLENGLKEIPEIDFRADLKWYRVVDEFAAELLTENGNLTEYGAEIAQEICSSIIPHASPFWEACTEDCSVFDPVYAQAAAKYAEFYLPQSCAEPQRFLKAQICLHQIIDEIDNSPSFVAKMQSVIEQKLGSKEFIEDSSEEYRQKLKAVAEKAVVGSEGMLCHRFTRVLQRWEDLELCGWTKEALTTMLNNKISRAAILNNFPFTPIEHCITE